jgi:NAD(P)-dependent dehydrogenase (short-subunit alcohol dehydrogenase family)
VSPEGRPVRCGGWAMNEILEHRSAGNGRPACGAAAPIDGEFTTTQDVAEAALFFASFESNALTGQSLVVSHGWYMQ